MNPEEELQSALTELEAGQPLEAVTRRHPELRRELTAAYAIRRFAARTLRPEAEQLFRARLAQQRRFPAQRAAVRWAVSLATLAALLLSGWGTAAASAHSVPGDPLYSVKRLLETARLAASPPAQAAALHLGFADERLAEFSTLAGRGEIDPALAAQPAAETAAALAAAASLPPEQQTEILQQIATLTDHEQAVIGSVLARAPLSAVPGLQRALAAADQQLTRARGLLARLPATATPLVTVTPPLAATATLLPTATLSAATTTAQDTHQPGATATAAHGTPAKGGPSGGGAKNTPAAQHTPNGGGCNPNNPTAPNACAATATATETPAPGDATACPTNKAGKPMCKS